MDSLDLQNRLIERAKAAWSGPFKLDRFALKPEADQLVKDIISHPHAYVIACLMDRRITAERAWGIPYELQQRLGSFEFSFLRTLSLQQLEEAMQHPTGLHALRQAMPVVLHRAIRRIDEVYNGDASAIWKGRPSSEAIVHRFREFYGTGPKISSMATNILVRDFRVEVADRSSIDISVDVHIRRIFARMGFVPQGASDEMIIARAREMNPEYPGILDLLLWNLGRERCRPTDPGCNGCGWKDGCAYATAGRSAGEQDHAAVHNKKLVIIECGNRKIWSQNRDAGPQRAEDAYTGSYFRANRRHALWLGSDWIILSAKYGFIPPDFRIPCAYNVTFNDVSTHPISVPELQEQVKRQGLWEYNEITVLGGRAYAERIREAFAGTNAQIGAPFVGMGMFAQMKAMKRAEEENTADPARRPTVAPPERRPAAVVSPAEASPIVPNTTTFTRALNELLSGSPGDHVDVTAGELHRMVGSTRGNLNRMATCCDVMMKARRDDDRILYRPRKGRGSRLKIRYQLPR
jgi:endonuclease III